MSDGIVESTVRLAVDGPRGRLDVAAPLWADVATVLESYAAETGEREELALMTSTGRVLETTASIQRLGLRHGELLIAVHTHPHDVEMTSFLDVRALRGQTAAPLPPWVPAVTAIIATVAAVLAASTAALLGVGPVRMGVAACLFLAAVSVPFIAEMRPRLRPWVMAAPAFAGAGAFVVTAGTGPGDNLLMIGAVGLAAAAAAAYGRAVAPGLADDELIVWLSSGATVAAVAVTGLLLESSGTAAWAVLLLVAVVAARVLPAFAVDVPDHVLIDFQRLAITAWSARDRPRRARRGIVRLDDVADVAHHGITLVSAGAIAVAIVSAASSALLLLSADDASTRLGARIMVVAGGISLTLGARAFRARIPRTALRLAGGLVLAPSVGLVVFDSGLSWQPTAAVLATVAGVLVAVAGLALGRGWRSVWWGRVAEVFDTLSVIALIGTIPLATGLFETVRQWAA
ncbi:hypothetical protein [Aeromicrobium sp. NPDC092404]|uniref:hypothetical protein n=1 Tax=Aeromicrobium sp. NPDC092404 TaxID=3154976 RepID=UPI00343822F6